MKHRLRVSLVTEELLTYRCMCGITVKAQSLEEAWKEHDKLK